MVSFLIKAENHICAASTGERFSSQQTYTSGWEEED